VRRVGRFLRYVLADLLRSLADRADPDLLVRRYAGGAETISRRHMAEFGYVDADGPGAA
jgi:hypothetical protein